jgi:capsule polysaccharide export protein KpsE/RkpR
LLSGIAGIFYSIYSRPEFESRLTFSLDAGANEGGLSGAMNLAAQFGLGIGSGQSMFDGDNIVEIMKSRRMIESVFLSVDTFNGKAFTLVEYYLENSGTRKLLDKNPRLNGVHFPVGTAKADLNYLQDSILYNAYVVFTTDNVTASRPDKKLGIYEVKIKTNDEKFSKVFTDRIVGETGKFYTEISSKKDKETLEILEQRVASLKSNVGTSIDTKASNQDANVNPAFAAAQSPLLRQQYNMQAYGEAYKEMFKTLEMARYQYLRKIPLLQIIDHADYPMKRIKPGKIKTALLFSIFSVLVFIFIIWLVKLFKSKPLLA